MNMVVEEKTYSEPKDTHQRLAFFHLQMITLGCSTIGISSYPCLKARFFSIWEVSLCNIARQQTDACNFVGIKTSRKRNF